jgi:signal transduction histidine kinase
MTINTHKRRSGDFKLMEQRAQGLESQVQELKRLMEKKQMGHCQDLANLRAKLGERCSKLEHDLHAAKVTL